jgi:hypothetical protein
LDWASNSLLITKVVSRELEICFCSEIGLVAGVWDVCWLAFSDGGVGDESARPPEALTEVRDLIVSEYFQLLQIVDVLVIGDTSCRGNVESHAGVHHAKCGNCCHLAFLSFIMLGGLSFRVGLVTLRPIRFASI